MIVTESTARIHDGDAGPPALSDRAGIDPDGSPLVRIADRIEYHEHEPINLVG
jgi:hypothetical protein